LWGYSAWLFGCAESDIKPLVTKHLLIEWLVNSGATVDSDYVKWEGDPNSPLLHYLLIDRSSTYVAIIGDDRLEIVARAGEYMPTLFGPSWKGVDSDWDLLERQADWFVGAQKGIHQGSLLPGVRSQRKSLLIELHYPLGSANSTPRGGPISHRAEAGPTACSSMNHAFPTGHWRLSLFLL